MENMENEKSFAWELLSEFKEQTKRLFIIIVLNILVILGMAALFVWYISLPTEEYSIEQDTDTGGNNYNIGGSYNGEAENN